MIISFNRLLNLTIFYSFKSTNPSSFATLPTVSNSSQRRLPNSDIHAFTVTPRCYRVTEIACSMTLEMVFVETWSAVVRIVVLS